MSTTSLLPAVASSPPGSQAKAADHVESDLLRAVIKAQERHAADLSLRLQDTTQELAGFSHAMTHDLRAPLRGIAGLARGLREDLGESLGEEARRVLDLVNAEAQRMGRLIEDLAAYSRVGAQRLELGAIAMTDLAQSAFQDLVEGRSAPAPSLRLGNLPVAYADRTLVREIFRRLLDNAIKFTPRADAEIVVVGEIAGASITYCIADNGVGFDPRYGHRLFTVFQRLHRSEDFPGSGLGLAVVRRIVQRHGGKTWAESTPSEGAKFYFSLPNYQEITS
jgi:light-regulated signal transduction histidine kinase (bacteriophytochrome)